MSNNLNNLTNSSKVNRSNKTNNLTNSSKVNNSNHRSLHKIQEKVIIKFLEMLNVIKLYHWKTRNYATHKATDELYERLNEHIDKFVEILLGKNEGRANLMNIESIPIEDFDDIKVFKKKINSYKSYLIGLNKKKSFDKKIDSDLFNVRDEILGDFNQFLYLLTFK